MRDRYVTAFRYAKNAAAGALALGLLTLAATVAMRESGAQITREFDARVHQAALIRSAIPRPAAPVIIIAPAQADALARELALSPKELVARWEPLVRLASSRFGVPANWIRAVMRQESGGRTMMDDGTPIRSDAGAMGIMQLMPATYAVLRERLGLGDNPYDPHDNIIAGVAYMQWLYRKYGYPGMFAAYNDGPANFDLHLSGKRDLPAETVAYVAGVTGQQVGGVLGTCKALGGRRDRHSMIMRLRLHCGAVGYHEIENQLNG